MKVVIKKHDDLDYLFAQFGGVDVLTKQDKFKRLEDFGFKLIDIELDETIHDDETTDFLNLLDFYFKKKGDKSHTQFENNLRGKIKNTLLPEHPYKKDIPLEVIVYVLIREEKRYLDVDVDNLVKSVLDCFNGLVYEDDSQINILLAKKIYFPHYNALLVAIRRLDIKTSWFKNIKLLSMQEGNEPKEWII